MGGGLKRLPWVGGPSPAKKAPSVGFVYFCVPHETQRLARTTKQLGRQALALPEVGSIAPLAAFQAIFFLSVYNFYISSTLLFFLFSLFPCCYSLALFLAFLFSLIMWLIKTQILTQSTRVFCSVGQVFIYLLGVYRQKLISFFQLLRRTSLFIKYF